MEPIREATSDANTKNIVILAYVAGGEELPGGQSTTEDVDDAETREYLFGIGRIIR